MRIEAHLPEEPWPEAYKAVACLLNRMPNRRLGWQTPFEKIQSAMNISLKPNIAHLRVYGCRTYPLKYNIPHSNKLVSKLYWASVVIYSLLIGSSQMVSAIQVFCWAFD